VIQAVAKKPPALKGEVLDSLRMSNSKEGCYRRCPRKYKFRYVEKLKAKRRTLPLAKGGWLHELLMVHYDGQDWRERQKALTQQFNNLLLEEREEYGDLPRETARIMHSYLAHYKEEDKHYKVLDTELDELVELPTGDMFNFIIDLVVEEDDGGIWLWDHKNVTSLMDEDFMLIDAQLAKYVWAAARIGYPEIRGVLFNELCTKAPTIPEQLKTGGLTQRKNLQCDVYTYYREIKRLGLVPRDYGSMLRHLTNQSDQWFRRTRMPRDKHMTDTVMRELMMTAREIKEATRLDHFPRTQDKSCKWGCEYIHMCITELQGGDIDDIAQLQFTTASREQDVENVHAKILTGGKS
jgi:hypothetical protein